MSSVLTLSFYKQGNSQREAEHFAQSYQLPSGIGNKES